jgi:hypothetical protein
MSGSPDGDDNHNPFGAPAGGGRARKPKDPFDGEATDSGDPFATGAVAGEEEEETGENSQGTSDA